MVCRARRGPQGSIAPGEERQEYGRRRRPRRTIHTGGKVGYGGGVKEAESQGPGALSLKDPVVAAAAIVGLLFVVFAVLLSVDAWPDAVHDVARWGMVLNILVATGVGALWLRRGKLGEAEAPVVEQVQPFRVAELGVEESASLARLRASQKRIEELNRDKNIDAIALVRELLSVGFSVGASDVHLTPEAEKLRFTLRVDGVLHEIGGVDRRHTPFVINRVKVLASLSIHVHSRPQDGRFSFDSEKLQARVSTLPTNHGEKVVVRLAVNDERRYDLDGIGFDDETLTLYKTMLSREHGVIYLTGPTGSGKTTTLYASMMFLRETLGDKVNLVTLEDPMEVDFQGIAQTQVNNAVGLSFATGLRSILRQDPDVIMVGEIRDEETGQTAIRAGLTGHLLLTTVHADSTGGVFQRMAQLNVDEVQLAGASIAVVNQRLAIRNCPDCTTKVEPTPLQEKQMKLFGLEPDGDFFAGQGCAACNGKGRRGRIPLIEVLPVTDRVRDMLIAGVPKHELEAAAREEGMRTIGMQALERAHGGQLPVEEVIRVLSL